MSEYWEERYASGGNSGEGSSGEQLDKKVFLINDVLRLNFSATASGRTINCLDIGCGDFEFGRKLITETKTIHRYYGIDTSAVIVGKNQALYGWEECNFYTPENLALGPPRCQLVCGLDLLFHITDDTEYFKMLDFIHAAWNVWTGTPKVLAITAYEYDGRECHHLKLRKFHPGIFGEPVVRRIIEEDGSKFLYIWRRQ